MRVITARNVNHALPRAIQLLRAGLNVRRIAPRGRSTLEYMEPVATVYVQPRERVLFSPARDANPFFHFFESLWIMAGRADVEWLRFFLPRITEYSDDGFVFHGAYGARMRRAVRVAAGGWRESTNQFENVVAELHRDRNSRRAVIGLWTPALDSGYMGKDMPCNCTLFFKLREGALNMLVANRSNDVIWGAYGANVVQFSVIQEVLASMLDASVGKYTQMSDSFHVYEDEPSWQRVLHAYGDVHNGDHYDPYTDTEVATGYGFWHPRPVDPYPLLKYPRTWFSDLDEFMGLAQGHMNKPEIIMGSPDWKNPLFHEVAVPLFNAYAARLRGDYDTALRWALLCAAEDWALAAAIWINRRAVKAQLEQKQ